VWWRLSEGLEELNPQIQMPTMESVQHSVAFDHTHFWALPLLQEQLIQDYSCRPPLGWWRWLSTRRCAVASLVDTGAYGRNNTRPRGLLQASQQLNCKRGGWWKRAP
jgi:hypothetical protein